MPTARVRSSARACAWANNWPDGVNRPAPRPRPAIASVAKGAASTAKGNTAIAANATTAPISKVRVAPKRLASGPLVRDASSIATVDADRTVATIGALMP
jgi:hypothetical protein